ncbi:MAG: SDR family oxidoreductase [Candidatus Rokubacteria bacterium]|nr:SDR family oxidoreductase [Candidatus Rokubacteria bacterium]
MDLGLKGKVAIVTGGSEGIGKATARALAREGAKVAICARRRDVLERATREIQDGTGGDVLPVVADVSKSGEVEHLVQTVVATYGRLDILVNNAGVGAAGAFEAVGDDAWHADLELKLFGAIRCARLAIPHMRAQGGGRIINVLNWQAKTPWAASTPTSVSRAAGMALTKVLSKEFAKSNILVNCVLIGTIKSAQNDRQYHAARGKNPALTLEQFYSEMAHQRGCPLGRAGEPEEAGDVIAFLASERASYVSGVALNLDGGASAVV